MIKILMVCHGNICRSTMAEFVLKDMVEKLSLTHQFKIASAGTSREEIGNDIHYGTKDKLTKKGIQFKRRKAVQVKKSDYDYYDYLICMDKENLRNLIHIVGEDLDNKLCLLLDFSSHPRDIADPWYTGNFHKTYLDVVEGCGDLLTHIKRDN